VTLDLTAVHLGKGSHAAITDTLANRQACVMEAVAFVAGEPWSDHPTCASTTIGTFLRSWNDTLDDDTRDRLLVPLIPRLIGSKGTLAQEEQRSWMACDWLVRTFTPAWLRKAGLDAAAETLEALPEMTSTELVDAALLVIREAQKQARPAGAAAAVTAGDAAWDAARAAAGAAAGAAAWDAAGDAAWDAAARAAAARAAARDAAAAAAGAAARAAAAAAAGAAARDAAWAAARDAARAVAAAAARDAAGAALADTVAVLQASAIDLLDRMLAITEEDQ
jgi:hypothetical protein